MNINALVHLNRQSRAPVTTLFFEFMLFAYSQIPVQRLHNGVEAKILQGKTANLLVISLMQVAALTNLSLICGQKPLYS